MRRILSTVFAASLLATTSIPALAQDAGWTPSGDVTFVVPFGAGGGSDVLARTIVNVVNELDLVPSNIIVDNRPGGSGAIGYNYLAEQSGNANFLGTVSVSFFTTPLLGASPVSYEDFTPVAAIAMSPYILVVPAASDIHNLDDLVARDRLSTGTVGVVSDAALLSQMMSTQSDTQIDAVPFDGEGEVIAALLGGHIDFMFANPGEVIPQVEAGTMRALAVSTDERLASLPDVPTLSEGPFDVSHVQLRGIVLPGDVPQEAVDFWQGVFQQVAESDAWREQYLERFRDEPRFLPATEFAAELEATNELYRGMMEQTGN